jgi:predicted DNA-binding protein (UPF0251 family)
MTPREKLAKAKMSLIELAEYLQNVSEACRVMGVSRQHFYDIKKAPMKMAACRLSRKSRGGSPTSRTGWRRRLKMR